MMGPLWVRMGQNMISIYSENRTHPAVERGSAGQSLGYGCRSTGPADGGVVSKTEEQGS